MYGQVVSIGLTSCLDDESKMVRLEAVKMIGSYVKSNPMLLRKYFDVILAKLRDEGAQRFLAPLTRCCDFM